MAVTSLSSSKQFNTYLQRFKQDYSSISFEISESTYWDPHQKTIFYNPDKDNPLWSLLHELGHMLCGHSDYKFDLQLLLMEKDAWLKAQEIASNYGLAIDSDYIQDCLDSYRDWLYTRSSCPTCYQTGIQDNNRMYMCMNCRDTWKVSTSRFCRTYRQKIK